jgi:membrane fusion protein (multidrug efflux system)
MRKQNKIILFSAIALIAAGIIFFPQIKKVFVKADAGKSVEVKSGKSRSQELSVTAKIITNQKLSDDYRSKGLLLPDEEVALSFETSGKITDILFEEGNSVQKGQLLAKVNDKPLQAELKKLEAQLPLARDRVHRQKLLLEKDAVSQEAYESVNTELEKLLADIELVKSHIAQSELRAPFDGILGLRQVSEGAYASPQTIITSLTKISPLKLEFSVNEKQAAVVQKGTKVAFLVENFSKTYTAEVYAIETKLDNQTLTLKVRARYANSDGKLKPGHSATTYLTLNEIDNAIVVPSISVIAEMGRDIVFTYKNGKAHQTIIQKGMRTASAVQITDGLAAGDTILTSGVMQLRDGMPVKIEKFIE